MLRTRLVLILLLLHFPLLLIAEYHFMRVWYSSVAQRQQLFANGLDPEGAREKSGYWIDAVLSDDDIQRFRNLGYRLDTVQANLEEYYAARLDPYAPRELGYGSMGGYYTYAEIGAQLDSLHATRPDLVSEKDTIGWSYEGRPIWALKISDNPDLDEGEPVVLYHALIHAREPEGMETILYFAWRLVDAYGLDPILTYLVNNRELWFIPVDNPDGYVYNEQNHPNGGGMHRKNMRPDCLSEPGVDLNRNWGYMWGYDNSGSSSNPCDQTYRGTAAFSEPETQALRDFIIAHQPVAVLNYHTYGNLLIRPYGYDAAVELPDSALAVFTEAGQDLVRDNHYLFGNSLETVSYLANGTTSDWIFGSQGILNYTPEVGSYSQGAFWPATEYIFPLAEENFTMNRHLALIAGHTVQFTSFHFSNLDFIQPESTYLGTLEVRNKGLTEAACCARITLTCPDSSLAIAVNEIQTEELPPLTSQLITGSDFTFTVQAQYGETATLIVTVDNDDAYSLRDTLQWIVGTPTLIFSDGAEDSLVNWTTDGWGLTTEAYSGDYAFTESPVGDYPNQADLWFILNHPLDFTGFEHLTLEFQAAWDIESDWDCAQVLASTDSITWIALPATHTHPGSGYGVQPGGEPVFDGQHDWSLEKVSLQDFAGAPRFWLAFRVRSDSYVNGDGFRVDNIKVLGWRANAPIVGDVNGDGELNVEDVTYLIEQILTLQDLDPTQFEQFDLNDDGAINVLDVVVVIEAILNS